MNDFDKYKTKVAYPVKRGFARYNVYKAGEILFKNELISFIANELNAGQNGRIRDDHNFKSDMKKCDYILEAVVNDDYVHALAQWQADSNRLVQMFKDDVFTYFGVTNNPKREQCYSIAWDKGHSAGLQEVYSEFAELVELIE